LPHLLSDLSFSFTLKTKRIADCLPKPALDTHLLLEVREKRRSPVNYASRSTNFVGRANAATISKPLPVFRTRKKSVRSASCESPGYEAHNVAKTRAEVVGREAFEEMFVASRSKFVAMAHGILRNREDAEDAVQNAFLSGYLHLRSFEGRSALSTWFTRIVLNAALMIQRKRKPSTFQPLPESSNSREVDWTENIPAAEPDPEMVHAERETLQLIDGILGKLKPVLRQAFTMTYFDELSRSEACAALGVSAGTFKARVFRARRQVLDQTERALVAPIHKTTLRRPHSLNAMTPEPAGA
jgi:RNA polymerase sigma-70 factor, ECF subfamily